MWLNPEKVVSHESQILALCPPLAAITLFSRSEFKLPLNWSCVACTKLMVLIYGYSDCYSNCVKNTTYILREGGTWKGQRLAFASSDQIRSIHPLYFFTAQFSLFLGVQSIRRQRSSLTCTNVHHFISERSLLVLPSESFCFACFVNPRKSAWFACKL